MAIRCSDGNQTAGQSSPASTPRAGISAPVDMPTRRIEFVEIAHPETVPVRAC